MFAPVGRACEVYTNARSEIVYRRAMLWLVAPILVLGGVYLHHVLETWRERRRYPPPGELIDVGGRRVHLLAMGEGNPTVILDSALASTSLSWTGIQETLSAHTRVVSYDRLGFGWSDDTTVPRTVDHMEAELAELLTVAGIPGPYVLVGHSYGGWVAQLFTSSHSKDVAGLVLVDTPHPKEWAEPSPARRARAAAGRKHASRASWAATFGWMRPLLWFLARRRNASSEKAENGVRALLERTPEEIRGPLRSFWVQGGTLRALASQIEHASESAATVAACLGSMGDIPLVVLTAAEPSDERLSEQLEIVGLSRRGRHVIAKTSGHWIPLEEPELIVKAVTDVLDA